MTDQKFKTKKEKVCVCVVLDLSDKIMECMVSSQDVYITK